MKIKSNILVSTTSHINGVEVKKMIGPISSHLVANTNLFSDLVASMGDLFGGRSHGYQQQISRLYGDAVEELKLKAISLGANGILGLQIDLDEVSGGGKSMFMITAIGTAIIYESPELVMENPGDGRPTDRISRDELKILKQKNEIVNGLVNGTLQINDDFWSFIQRNQIKEVYSYLIRVFEDRLAKPTEFPDELSRFFQNLTEYISGFSDSAAKDLLYSTLVTTDNEQLSKKICEMIGILGLVDYNKIRIILNHENFGIKKKATSLLVHEKQLYTKQDCEIIAELIQNLALYFPEKGIRAFKKQLLSSKEKEVWNCECGKSNELGEYCQNCHKDIYGFTRNETNPLKTIEVLKDKLTLLNDYFQ